MTIKQLKLGNMDNFEYIITDEKTKKAMIVDPGWEVETLIEEAKGYEIVGIILTHTHWDHIQELDKAVEITNAPVYVHKHGIVDINTEDKEIIQLKDQDTITLGELQLTVMHTPGHCPSAICLLAEGWVITGDTLFVEACGRCDLPGSNPEEQWDSLQKLKLLDDNTKVYSGHDYGSVPVSTIHHEKNHNPYMMCETKEEFLTQRMG